MRDFQVVENEIHVPINSDQDIVAARQKGRSMAAALGFSSGDATLIATAISELRGTSLLTPSPVKSGSR